MSGLLELAEPTRPPRKPLADRFWPKVEKRAPAECWEWTGYKSSLGYGQIMGADQKLRGAHRVSYELAGGVIPAGYHLDHLCRNPRCVNPAHLEPVTPRENTRRGDAGKHVQQRAALLTHCKHGHPINDTNTYRDKRGRRSCKVCAIARQNVRRATNRAHGLPRDSCRRIGSET